jgi:hypothetical protein
MNDRRDPRTGAARKDPHGFDGLDGDAEAWSTPAPEPGSPLPPFRPSLSLHRTRFAIRLPDASTATVDVDHRSGRASLYRNDRHVQNSDMPVRFARGADSLAGIERALTVRHHRLLDAETDGIEC